MCVPDFQMQCVFGEKIFLDRIDTVRRVWAMDYERAEAERRERRPMGVARANYLRERVEADELLTGRERERERDGANRCGSWREQKFISPC